jgi:hypothetical protein
VKEFEWLKAPVVLEHVVQNPRIFLLAEELSARWRDLTITVLPEFPTDGASIPRLFWWIAPPFAGPYASAAVLHDALYRSQVLTRDEADRIFRLAMLESGVSAPMAWTFWASVRSFGWTTWNYRSPQQVEMFARKFVRLETTECA